MLRRLGSWLLAFGVAGVAGSYEHWHWFYANVLNFLGERGPLPTACLLQSPPPCRLASAAAWIADFVPYDPTYLWVSLTVACLGVLLLGASLGNRPRRVREFLDDAELHKQNIERTEPRF